MAQNNPELDCLEVDNPEWSTSSWENVDEGTLFQVDCAYAILSVEDFDAPEIKLYPNPAQMVVHFEGKEELEQVQVLNITGQSLYSLKGNIWELNVEDLAAGIYLLRMKTATHEGIYEFIKK